jgi:hypothetical protein
MRNAPYKTATFLRKSLPAAVAVAALGSAPLMAAQPYERPDGSMISISGTVTSPEADEFVLDYGDGTILVEMDDWDSFGDAHGLMDGDRVTVYGRIDDDFFEMAKIEAGSVYVENLNTFFYANSADEESAMNTVYWAASAPVVISDMTLRGEVIEVDAEEGEFTVSTGDDEIEVYVDSLGYNPLDDFGYQKIDEGDWVSVAGAIDYEFIDGQVLRADMVTTLIDDSENQSS